VGKTAIVPSDPAAALDRHVPDLANWPQSWRVEQDDVPLGEHLVEAFKPFLIELIQKGFARKTLRRHRDNLWMLGGEIIRHRHMDDEFAAMTIDNALLDRIDEFGGPILSGRSAESEQQEFDATCKKLYRFLIQSSNP